MQKNWNKLENNKNNNMKKIVYFIVVAIMCVIGFPFMIFCRDKWNAFGRKVDGAFKIESPHTKNYNASNHEQ